MQVAGGHGDRNLCLFGDPAIQGHNIGRAVRCRGRVNLAARVRVVVRVYSGPRNLHSQAARLR